MAVIDVSIVTTIFNASKWLPDALDSVLLQTFSGALQLSIFNDGSADDSMEVVKGYIPRLKSRNVEVVIDGHKEASPKGPGYGRMQAVRQSSGSYICILDADDVMHPQRIEKQYTAALSHPNALIGSRYTRLPENSTERYTRWSNGLSQDQLYTQAFTSYGPSIIQPTWFCSREVFEAASDEQYSKQEKGNPEDLIFFYKHLSFGGKLFKLDESLLVYRYREGAATFDVDRWTIWNLRVIALQDFVLEKWSKFTIWNAGKQGRRLFKSLKPVHQAKVVAFCDVDQKKIDQKYYTYLDSQERLKVPIVHFSVAEPPFILCVKLDFTDGEFEQNLASLKLREGVDYYHFS